MAIRAVFFDLDDTLCDTIGTREERARRAFSLLCREHPRLDTESLVARAMAPAGDRLVTGVPAVLRELGLAETPTGTLAAGIWYFEGCLDLVRPHPGVVETVAVLRRSYTLGIVTNGETKLQRAKCAQLALGIEHVIISEECGHEKPDARIFRHAAAAAGTEPREAVFVGDRLDVDIGGAQAAGMRTVWFNHYGGAPDGGSPRPDAVIRRFTELPKALRRIA